MRGRGGRTVVVSIVTLLSLAAGCAGPTTRIADSPTKVGSAVPAARELSGTWQGSYWQLGMVYYDDDADCTLRIEEDSTFTATCKRAEWGTNNIAQASSWSGRVTTKGNRVILESDGGAWPWIVLTRSGNDTLYGVTLDPPVGATVEMEFERQPGAASTSAATTNARPRSAF